MHKIFKFCLKSDKLIINKKKNSFQLMRYLLTIFVLFCASLVFAQNSFINGRIINKNNNRPIEYSVIELFNEQDSLLNGTVTDSTGVFILKTDFAGKCTLKIGSFGYKLKTLNFTIFKDKTYDIGDIYPETESYQLDEVIIQNNNYQTQHKFNKSIFNITNKQKLFSADSYDVLSKLPGLNVYYQNNTITFEDKKNIKLLINGVPQNDTKVILSIPPEFIKKVEIITNPSIKYNKDETDCIINIITDKNIGGLYIFANPELSYKHNYNNSYADIIYSKNKISFGLSYFLYYRSNPFNTSDVLVRNNSNDSIYVENAETVNNSEKEHNFNYSFDWFVNKKNTLNITGEYSFYNRFLRKSHAYNINTGNNISSTMYSNYIHNIPQNNISAYYEHKNAAETNKLVADVNFYFTKNKLQTDYFESVDPELITRVVKNDFDRESINIAIEYEYELNKKVNINTGANYYHQNTYYISLDDEDNAIEKADRSNAFTSIVFNFEKITINIGAKYEKYVKSFKNEIYLNKSYLYPDAGIYWKMNKFNSISLNYEKNISFPRIYSLHPSDFQINEILISAGNPFLHPYVSHNSDIYYKASYKSLLLSTKLYFNKSVNKIENFYEFTNENYLIGQSQNISTYKNTGIFIQLSLREIFNILTLNSSFRYSYNEYLVDENNEYGLKDIKETGRDISSNLYLTITPKISFYSNVSIHSPSYSLQSKTINPTVSNYSAINFSILKRKGLLKVFMIYPIYYKENSTTYYLPGFTYETTFDLKFKVFGISFRYNFDFGNKTVQTKRETKMEDNS